MHILVKFKKPASVVFGDRNFALQYHFKRSRKYTDISKKESVTIQTGSELFFKMVQGDRTEVGKHTVNKPFSAALRHCRAEGMGRTIHPHLSPYISMVNQC